jgi:TatD DNase family protein
VTIGSVRGVTRFDASPADSAESGGAGPLGGWWVDSHCHVYDERMPGGPEGAVAEAVAAGVDLMVAVGCDRATSQAALDLAARSPHVVATVGLHPHEARFGVDTVRDLLAGSGPVAVGECGLDYHYDHSPRADQRDAFAEQVSLANDLGLPLVIHTRSAWPDTFDVLDATGVPDRTIFHCFTGGPDEARECLRRGAWLSFSGIVTFPTATEIREAAARCPLDRLLVETDSPYLAPVPHRGKQNRPAWVPHVGACIADIHDLPVDQVQLSTATAARTAFGLAR